MLLIPMIEILMRRQRSGGHDWWPDIPDCPSLSPAAGYKSIVPPPPILRLNLSALEKSFRWTVQSDHN